MATVVSKALPAGPLQAPLPGPMGGALGTSLATPLSTTTPAAAHNAFHMQVAALGPKTARTNPGAVTYMGSRTGEWRGEARRGEAWWGARNSLT